MGTSFSSASNAKPITFARKLDTVGNGTGTTDMAVDGSGTPAVYRIKPAVGQIFQISRLIFYIEDASSIDTGGWGGVGGGNPLTNGCLLQKKQGGSTNTGILLNSNGHLASIMYDVNHEKFGSGNEFLVGRLTFTKFGGEIRLIGDNGDELLFTIQDDLTGLDAQYVTAQGWIEDTEY